jgi:hypothetical protein
MIEITLDSGGIIFVSKASSIYVDGNTKSFSVSGFKAPIYFGSIKKLQHIGRDQEEEDFLAYFRKIIAP